MSTVTASGLVRGNFNESDVLYLNTGTGLDTTASLWWSGGPSTQSVALGDVDGDGRLTWCVHCYQRDNGVSECGHLIRSLSSWSTWPRASEDTRSIALGDANGDGHLDDLRADHGVRSSHNRVLQRGTGFDFIGPMEVGLLKTVGVALGDVDGDGDLDPSVRNYEGKLSARQGWDAIEEHAIVAIGFSTQGA